MLAGEVGDRPGGQDPPAVHYGHAVTQPFDFAHDVGREHHAPPLATKVGDDSQQRAGDQHIETGGRLVEDHHGGVVHEGAGNGRLLPHAGRQLRPGRLAKVIHLQAVEQRLHAGSQRRARHTVQPTVILDELPGSHPVVNASIARHVADVGADLGRLRHHVEPGDGGGSGSGLQHRPQHPQAGGLSRAIGPEQSEDLPRSHLKRNTVNRNEGVAREIFVVLCEALRRDHEPPAASTGRECEGVGAGDDGASGFGPGSSSMNW